MNQEENNKKYKMTGKDAFLALGSCILAKNKHYCDNDVQLLCDKTNEIISPQRAAGLVLEELELGEKYKKVIEIIKKKKVDVKLLLDNNDDRIRPEYRFFDYNCTRKYEEKLDQEEFDLLIEVLEK